MNQEKQIKLAKMMAAKYYKNYKKKFAKLCMDLTDVEQEFLILIDQCVKEYSQKKRKANIEETKIDSLDTHISKQIQWLVHRFFFYYPTKKVGGTDKTIYPKTLREELTIDFSRNLEENLPYPSQVSDDILLDSIRKKLTKDEYEVFYSLTYKGVTEIELANDMNITQQYVSLIKEKAKVKIKRLLEKEGITEENNKDYTIPNKKYHYIDRICPVCNEQIEDNDKTVLDFAKNKLHKDCAC